MSSSPQVAPTGLHRQSRRSSYKRFQEIYGGAILVLLSGLIASLALFVIALLAESRAWRGDLNAHARDHALVVQTALVTRLEDVHSLRALFSAIEDVSREEFGIFARDLLSHVTGVQALEWVPRVPLERREEFESRAQADGFPDYEFMEGPPGSMYRAGMRPEYYPVFYIEPLLGNEEALGFDLASNPERYAAIRKSVESRQPAATSPLVLVQETGEQVAVLVFFPVHDGTELRGLVLGVLRVGDLLLSALSGLQKRPIDVTIWDVTDREVPLFLAHSLGGQLASELDEPTTDPGSLRETFSVADRTWMVVARPASGQKAFIVTARPLGLLLIGVVATLSLAGFLVHRVRIEQRVRGFERELAHLARVATSGEMAASIAHEINQPLCAIVLNAQAAKRMADPSIGPILDRVVQDGERAGETIRNFREFVRDAEIVQRPVDLATIVRDTVEMFSVTDQTRHPVEIWVQPGLAKVTANEVQIQQVLLNLLRNAAEAVDSGRGQDRLISVSVEAGEAGRIVTNVDDAGPGVDPDEVSRFFAPFFTTKEHGMGMGLSICKTIIESHGGNIRAGISPAGGARFSFSLLVAEGV